MGCSGGVGAPGVNGLMGRFDGAPPVVPLGVLLWAKALLAVHGNTNRTPQNAVVRNFIRTLFPAQCTASRFFYSSVFTVAAFPPASAKCGFS
jgi:hypothetical protein